MPSPALKGFSIRKEKTQKDSLVRSEEDGTVDGGENVIQERMKDADETKVTAKKEAKIVKCREKQG